MFNRDLMYICEWVDELQIGISAVRLDSDGEICFKGTRNLYYSPEGEYLEDEHPSFIPDRQYSGYGVCYSRQEFLACKEYLANNTTSTNTPVGEATSPVIEKVKLRIQEITKRHEQALADELKPLIEVLQRRGEIL